MEVKLNCRQIRAVSKSYTRLRHSKNLSDPYEDLANAIICFAVDDYRKALKKRNRGVQKECEHFFSSSWFGTLSSLDPDLLVSLLHKEYEEYKESRKRKKSAPAAS